MSPLRKLAANEVMRLAGMPGWANLERQAKTELADTLASCAANEFHAHEIITQILSTSQWLPTPADVRAAAQTARTSPAPIGSGGCAECQHTGRISGWYLVTLDRYPSGDVKGYRFELIPSDGSNYWLMHEPNIQTGDDQMVRMCTRFCRCALGERLRAGALQRRHEEALSHV